MHIRKLQLHVADLGALANFYGQTLQLPTADHGDSAVIAMGTTEILFVRSRQATPYHFAINIPSNLVKEAHQWLAERVELLPYEDEEIIDFPNWNAEAMYFYDPAQNIVELIARHNLKVEGGLPFSGMSLIAVSEIGIAPDSLEHTIKTLTGHCRLEVFDGGPQRFCAIGDEFGLFIAVDRRQKGWMPTDDEIFPSPLQLIMDTNGQTWRVEFDGRRITCHSANFLS